MLAAIGVNSMDDLLVDIPGSLRIPALELPAGLSELETMAQIEALAARNRIFADRLTFRGGGVYRRFIPAAVAAVTSKPEFYTAYTPYQPEASQGTLQAIYEFQTLIAELTGQRPAVDFAPWRAGDQRYYVSDTRRLQQLTGWQPQVGVKLGVRRLLQWLRQLSAPAAALPVTAERRRPEVAGQELGVMG